MAVIISAITSLRSQAGASATGAASNFTSYSFTPAANSVLLLTTSNGTSTVAPIGPTVTGFGSTWTSLQSSSMSGSLALYRNCGFFWAQIGASPSADTVNLSFATAQNFASMIIDQVTGIDTSGPVVQSAASYIASNSTCTTILSAFGSANNGTYGSFVKGGALGAYTVGGNFTALSQLSGGPNHTMLSEWTGVNATSVDAGINSSANSHFGFAAELKASVAGGGGAYYQQFYRTVVAA